MPIKENIVFEALNIAVLTVSDTRTLADDRSGATLVNLLQSAGHRLAWHDIVTDDIDDIESRMQLALRDAGIDVLLCTGGTGITVRDVTPEAFERVVEKKLDGFAEIFRMQSFAKIGISALQSRTCAGVAQKTLVFVLPGSPGACRDAWLLLGEMLDNRYRPCNLSEMRPRL